MAQERNFDLSRELGELSALVRGMREDHFRVAESLDMVKSDIHDVTAQVRQLVQSSESSSRVLSDIVKENLGQRINAIEEWIKTRPTEMKLAADDEIRMRLLESQMQSWIAAKNQATRYAIWGVALTLLGGGAAGGLGKALYDLITNAGGK